MTRPTIPTELVAPIFNPATFADRDAVHAMLTRLRRDYPLAVAEVPGYDPHWIVTRYKDLREVARQDAIFHSGDRSKTLASRFAEQLMRDYSGGPQVFRMIAHMDEPDHSAHRNVLAASFVPQNIARMEESVMALARSHVDRMAAMGGACDFVPEVAGQYPVEMICDLLGVPREDKSIFIRLAHWFFCYADPDLQRPGADPADPGEIIKTWTLAYDEFKHYFGEIIADRRRTPRNDLSTVLVNGQVHGRPMDERAIISYFAIVSTAGHDTTTATLANSMVVLAERPELLARLKADLSLLPRFIEEAIRWASPAQHFIRSATQDYELAGQKIREGDLLYLSYLSGNRDEAEFPDPFTFDIDRMPNRHLGFGYGAHICLGQHLSRLEMRCFWEALLPRLEAVELTGPVQWIQAEFVCGPKSVPIRYRMS